MMKPLSIVALCCVGLFLSFAVPFPGRAAEKEPASLKEELVKLEKQSWEAWKKHDGKFFEGFLSDDHAEIGFGGVTSSLGLTITLLVP